MVEERTRNLEEANRSLETFSHALSHDLKKPIRHMVSYAEVLQESLACGFNAGMQSHIFQMFGRANPDNAIVGDGIGLALCQRIIQAHGGRIWAQSHPGKGSEFFVFLPRAGHPHAARQTSRNHF